MHHSTEWRKSSYSQNEGQCVEVARLDASHYGVRDSTRPDADHLTIPTTAWAAFVTAVRDNEPSL